MDDKDNCKSGVCTFHPVSMGPATAKPNRLSLKILALMGACGLACAAPLIFAGVGAAGLGLGALGFEVLGFGALALVALSAVAYYIYKRKAAMSAQERKNNADRCRCQ